MAAKQKAEQPDDDRVLYAHFTWAGGTHRFALPMDDNALGLQWHGVQDPHPRLRRLLTGAWTVDDIVATVRGGLIGGRSFSAYSVALQDTIRRHVTAQPLADNLPLAKAILLVALFGVPKKLADTAVDASVVADVATDDHLQALEPDNG